MFVVVFIWNLSLCSSYNVAFSYYTFTRPCVHRQVVSSLILFNFFFCCCVFVSFSKENAFLQLCSSSSLDSCTDDTKRLVLVTRECGKLFFIFCLLCYSSSWLENLETKSSRQGQPGALLMRWRAGFSRYDGISIRRTCGV